MTHGLIIAYTQVRLPAKRAKPVLRRQVDRLEGSIWRYGIPVDAWYQRVKGLSPLPTIEERIDSGQVYCVVVDRWDRLRGCKGHWDELWPLLDEHQVRHIWFSGAMDMRYHDEPDLFRLGYFATSNPEPAPPPKVPAPVIELADRRGRISPGAHE